MSLEDFLRLVDPEDRSTAREWGNMGRGEFQARIGPKVERLADLLEGENGEPGVIEMVAELRLQDGHRWYDFRVSDIAKIAGGGGFASAVAAVIARFG